MTEMKWHPAWWNGDHENAWTRAKEALRRDWEQTKHDAHMKGGHELNQDIGHTVRQASGKEPIPAPDRANPPRVIGDWNDVELPLEYGYSARTQYGGRYSHWTPELEKKLEREWTDAQITTGYSWSEVSEHVRRGYEAKH
jgi:hypothetical protein